MKAFTMNGQLGKNRVFIIGDFMLLEVRVRSKGTEFIRKVDKAQNLEQFLGHAKKSWVLSYS